jgi:hypothetical protein
VAKWGKSLPTWQFLLARLRLEARLYSDGLLTLSIHEFLTVANEFRAGTSPQVLKPFWTDH